MPAGKDRSIPGIKNPTDPTVLLLLAAVPRVRTGKLGVKFELHFALKRNSVSGLLIQGRKQGRR